MHLWHYPIYPLIERHWRLPGAWAFVACYAASLVVAAPSLQLVERPFLRLKDRLRPRAERDKPVLV